MPQAGGRIVRRQCAGGRVDVTRGRGQPDFVDEAVAAKVALDERANSQRTRNSRRAGIGNGRVGFFSGSGENAASTALLAQMSRTRF